jgi:signal transduction histidine kinase
MLASGVLVLRVDAAPFLRRELNPVLRENRTGRTSLVAREDDDVVVLASESNAPTGVLPRRSRRDTPGWVLAALDGRTTHGVADGEDALFGAPVAYAAAPLPSLDWAVVRQRDRAELLHMVRWPLAIESAIWALLGLLAIAAAALWHRGRAARRDREAVRLRTDFVSGVSHELRTPLAQIRLFAQLLRAGTLRSKEETERALRVIDQEARRLTFLVDNVLNFAKSEHGTARVQPVVTEVVGEIIEALEAFEPLAEERGVSLREDMQTGLYALVDPRALRQVLLNFLDNAVKYGPRGGTVTVGAAQTSAGMVRVWVDDEGKGVSPSERENVWRPFYRLQRAEQQETGGAGIGLAVVHELVLQHGGTVWVEDAPGGGARFIVEFPATARTPTPVHSMIAAVRQPQPPVTGAGANAR